MCMLFVSLSSSTPYVIPPRGNDDIPSQLHDDVRIWFNDGGTVTPPSLVSPAGSGPLQIAILGSPAAKQQLLYELLHQSSYVPPRVDDPNGDMIAPHHRVSSPSLYTMPPLPIISKWLETSDLVQDIIAGNMPMPLAWCRLMPHVVAKGELSAHRDARDRRTRERRMKPWVAIAEASAIDIIHQLDHHATTIYEQSVAALQQQRRDQQADTNLTIASHHTGVWMMAGSQLSFYLSWWRRFLQPVLPTNLPPVAPTTAPPSVSPSSLSPTRPSWEAPMRGIGRRRLLTAQPSSPPLPPPTSPLPLSPSPSSPSAASPSSTMLPPIHHQHDARHPDRPWSTTHQLPPSPTMSSPPSMASRRSGTPTRTTAVSLASGPVCILLHRIPFSGYSCPNCSVAVTMTGWSASMRISMATCSQLRTLVVNYYALVQQPVRTLQQIITALNHISGGDITIQQQQQSRDTTRRSLFRMPSTRAIHDVMHRYHINRATIRSINDSAAHWTATAPMDIVNTATYRRLITLGNSVNDLLQPEVTRTLPSMFDDRSLTSLTSCRHFPLQAAYELHNADLTDRLSWLDIWNRDTRTNDASLSSPLPPIQSLNIDAARTMLSSSSSSPPPLRDTPSGQRYTIDALSETVEGAARLTYIDRPVARYLAPSSLVPRRYLTPTGPMQIMLLGMHHSGTSLLAGLLNQTGVFVNEQEAPPDPNRPTSTLNSRGFWEHWEMTRTSEMILRAHGSQWFNVCSIHEQYLDDNCPWNYRTETDVVDHESKKLIALFNKPPIWLVKDPRSCVLMPHWKRYLTNGVCIILYRYPEAIVRSLARWNVRQGLSRRTSISLWERHAVGALNGCIDMPTIIVSHEDLLKQPYETVSMIVSHLRMIGSGDGMAATDVTRAAIHTLHDASRSDIAAFYDPSLNHFKPRAATSLASSSSSSSATTTTTDLPVDIYEYMEHIHDGDDGTKRVAVPLTHSDCSTGIVNHRACSLPVPNMTPPPSSSPTLPPRPQSGFQQLTPAMQAAHAARKREEATALPLRAPTSTPAAAGPTRLILDDATT